MISGKRVLRYLGACYTVFVFDLHSRIKVPWRLPGRYGSIHAWNWSMLHRIQNRVKFKDAMDKDDVFRAARLLRDG